MRRSITQPLWKKIFCVCNNDSQEDLVSPDERPKPLLSSTHHYTPQKNMQRSNMNINESAISLQLSQINEANRNNIQFITNTSDSMCFLVYYTEINFKQEFHRTDPKQIFELYSEQMFYDSNDKITAPEFVCKYLAQRANTGNIQSVIDVNPYYNQHTIQFARVGLQVISVSKDLVQLNKACDNISIYKIREDKVQQVAMDLSKTKMRLKTDLVFLNLTQYRKKNTYEIHSLLLNSFKLTKNVTILLKQRDDSQKYAQKMIRIVVDMLTLISAQHPSLIKNYGFQQENIKINGKPEYTVLYFGLQAKFPKGDEIVTMSNSLLLKEQLYQGYQLTEPIMTSILNTIISKVGKTKLFQIFIDALYKSGKDDNLLESFFGNLKMSHILTVAQFQDIVQDCQRYSPTKMYLERSIKNHPSTNKKLESVTQRTKTISFDLNESYDKTNHTFYEFQSYCQSEVKQTLQSHLYKV